jgi:hypothetical protein
MIFNMRFFALLVCSIFVNPSSDLLATSSETIISAADVKAAMEQCPMCSEAYDATRHVKGLVGYAVAVDKGYSVTIFCPHALCSGCYEENSNYAELSDGSLGNCLLCSIQRAVPKSCDSTKSTLMHITSVDKGNLSGIKNKKKSLLELLIAKDDATSLGYLIAGLGVNEQLYIQMFRNAANNPKSECFVLLKSIALELESPAIKEELADIEHSLA